MHGEYRAEVLKQSSDRFPWRIGGDIPGGFLHKFSKTSMHVLNEFSFDNYLEESLKQLLKQPKRKIWKISEEIHAIFFRKSLQKFSEWIFDRLKKTRSRNLRGNLWQNPWIIFWRNPGTIVIHILTVAGTTIFGASEHHYQKRGWKIIISKKRHMGIRYT